MSPVTGGIIAFAICVATGIACMASPRQSRQDTYGALSLLAFIFALAMLVASSPHTA